MNLNRYDLISLRLFVGVVELGSLTLGAKEFGISLAAASKRISELEAHVGQVLLVRGKKGVVPSPAGQAMYRHSVELVGRLVQLSHAMEDFQRGAHGHLRIWANPSAFAHFLPHMVSLMAPSADSHRTGRRAQSRGRACGQFRRRRIGRDCRKHADGGAANCAVRGR